MVQPTAIPTPIAEISATVLPKATDSGTESKPPVDVRVLHIVNGEHFSGSERVQSHLGRCLPKFGVAADFACIKPGRFAELLDEHEGRWGRRHNVPLKNGIDLRAAWQIRDLIQNQGYDLLHAHNPRTAMIASIASRLANVPWVYHVHRSAARDSTRQLSNRINALLERQSLRNCSHLINVSESLRCQCVAGGVADDNVSVVHNGVPAIRPPRDATPTPGGRWTIGMIALMRPRKGLEVVLESLQQLAADGHDVVLRCIGPFETAEYEAEVETHIQRLGVEQRVQRVGFTHDVPLALSKLDALVLPSLCGEGLPMVVLEAMAAALPVIATRVEGTPEAITDRVEGLLAEPGDAASLSDKIRSLVTGECDWSEMSEAASKRHADCFSDLAMAHGTAEVYRKVLG